MKFFVGVTNNEWFEYLAARQPDEVNFWRPRSQSDFRAIPVGAPFLFKLHAPLNFIAGGGFFAEGLDRLFELFRLFARNDYRLGLRSALS